MAVFRIEKTRDYTVMSNHHLKDRTLTLKSKGLLSMMLSLPDEWNYTTRGLAAICREGVDSIGAALKELETHGYIRRTQLRDEKGKITDTEYVIYEMPQCEPSSSPGTPLPGTAKPYTENPDMGIPDTADPCTETPAQLNTNQTKTDLSSTEISNPIQSNPPTPTGARMGTDRMGARECYREVILDNIEYSYLVQDNHIDREQLDEIVDLIVDTVCSARKVIRIAGDDYPAEVVKSRFMKLDSSHVQYGLGGLVELGNIDQLIVLMKDAFQEALVCTNDPECLNNIPAGNNSNGAACHSCCMISETACENGNRMLDRGLIVPIDGREEQSYFKTLVEELCQLEV